MIRGINAAKYDFKKFVTDKKLKMDQYYEKELHDIKLHITQNIDFESKNLFNYAKEQSIPGTLKEEEKKGFFSSIKKKEEKVLVEETTFDEDEKFTS